MGDNREVKYTYPEILEQLRGRQNEPECLYKHMDRIMTEVDLESAETCLSIGTGPGEYDIEFIKRCLPKLKRFIAVENDPDCVTQLRSNVKKSLPHLDKVIHQESIKELKGPDFQVDVILLFHVFYYFEREDRLKLMEKFQSWLKPHTGVMVVVNMSDEVEKVDVFQKVFRELDGLNPALLAEDLKKEFFSMSLVVHPVFKFHCTIDLRNLGADLLKMLFPPQGVDESHEANVRKALEKVAPSGVGKCVTELFAVKCR